MGPDADMPQRIGRLMPLADLVARVDALVEPVAAREVATAAAVGRVLADAVDLPARPAVPLALRDGWAVASDLTHDASSYAPAPLPATQPIAVGAVMPPDADAVASLDTVEMRGARAHVLAPLAPGDGVLARGGDIEPPGLVLPAGTRLTRLQAAVLAAAGASDNPRVRAPMLHLVGLRSREDAVIAAACELIGSAILAAGGCVRSSEGGGLRDLEKALAAEDADAIVAVGGTGSGPDDAAVKGLVRRGRLEAHGIAVTPGETAAFGMVGRRPVLLLPGRVDAALAVWLTIGRRVLRRLSGAAAEDDRSTRARLTRKIASAPGLTELIAVRIEADGAEPIASGYLSMATLATSDGWVLVPAESEGYPAGAEVVIRAWP